MASDNRATPPHGPWSAFISFIRELAGTTVPPRIDNSLFRGKSGTAAYQLRGALNFFGFTEGEDNETTDALKSFVAVADDRDALTAYLKELLPASYAAILNGINLEAGTRQQLEEAFRERGGVTGSVNRKAIRFFLNGMSDAGFGLSPHFGVDRLRPTQVGRENVRRGNGRARAKKPPAPAAEAEEEKRHHEGTERIAFPVPGGRTIHITLPSDLSSEEVDYLLTSLTGYFKLQKKRED